MAHFMPPALLALFAPRPTIPYKGPLKEKRIPKLTGIAKFVEEFGKTNELNDVKSYETPQQKRQRRINENKIKHKKILEERLKLWDPHKNKNATKDAYKTLFVARLSYELNEDNLKNEFSRYGDIKDIKLIRDNNGKSRGYAFIEFDKDTDLRRAFKNADGMKLNNRRILVDVERGRTVPGWKPRKLAGGLGKTRINKNDKKTANNKNKLKNNNNNNNESNNNNNNNNNFNVNDYELNNNNHGNYKRDKYKEYRFKCYLFISLYICIYMYLIYFKKGMFGYDI